ncbi:ABC transporter permease [Actinosynnema sp. NPDC047251]|uniref:ABC-type aliphatic sulfonates transporter,permease subunit n=1 Tax=Saccharothrix espanaensis (strain ATCC 51144 / DSM 44229 / JCM 9112 / NBRC 15066 / NRRL 15764) TaxID=1179773 RepID=K0KFG5_SACES|nr:ABC transporter permease [Saccharothrix espanaensis]CCH35509.1 ABC-type aliphatic sulfonates transporter,permease subunit [Saccharothrix espanaensis DSM 44229]
MSISTAGVVARPESGTASRTPAKNNRKWPDLARWISPLGLVLLWQAASGTGVLPPDKLASPLTVLGSGYALVLDGSLVDAFLVSLGRVAVGFVLGALLGGALGLAAGLSRWGDRLVDPPVQMLRTLPHLGLIPLFILWFGIGEEPKLALVAAGVAFPLYLNLHAGIRQTDPALLEAARVLGFSRFERVVHVVLPSAVPQTLVGLRISLGTAWLSLIVGEQVNADAGIGFLINNAREFLRTDVVVVGLVVYALLGLTTDALVRGLERRVLRWRAR